MADCKENTDINIFIVKLSSFLFFSVYRDIMSVNKNVEL